jgi:hypothetical protein
VVHPGLVDASPFFSSYKIENTTHTLLLSPQGTEMQTQPTPRVRSISDKREKGTILASFAFNLSAHISFFIG